MGDRCLTTFGDNSQCVVCTDVDGRCLRRVLGTECVSEAILSLFSECVWLSADRMLDTKLSSVFLVDEFQATVLTAPLWVAPDFERDTLVVLEICHFGVISALNGETFASNIP